MVKEAKVIAKDKLARSAHAYFNVPAVLHSPVECEENREHGNLSPFQFLVAC
jgi:hypothetical protein